MNDHLVRRLTLEDALRLAVTEAAKGAPFVAPNPAVGCVILDAQGHFLSSGYHEVYGSAHAEVNALRGLSAEQLRDAHVVVTLEPCAHQGKTPSCAKALAKLPVKKVTYGIQDPNPLVAGKGHQILEDAGIEAQNYSASSGAEPALQRQIEKVCEIFLKNFRDQNIFVAGKLAQSLDGKMSLDHGESKWITGEKSREHSHYLRACYDLTVVGSGTVLQDDPQLNIRHPLVKKENKILVIDPQGQAAKKKDLKLFSANQPANIFFAVSNDVAMDPDLLKTGRNFIYVPPQTGANKLQDGKNLFHWDDLLVQLWARGIKSIFVEGGAQTLGHLLQKKKIHRLHVFQGMKILGGTHPGWSRFLHLESMSKVPNLNVDESLLFDQDLYLSGLISWPMV